MAISEDYTNYILDQLSQSGDVRHRKMFGGIGIYIDEIFCALISSSNRFYLRIGPDNLDDFKQQGMQKLPGGKGAGMPYYEVPEEVVEDPAVLAQWVRKSVTAAVQARK